AYPLVPLLFAAVMVWIVLSALHSAPRESIATLVLILLGLPLSPLFPRRPPLSPLPPAPRAAAPCGHFDSSSQSVSGAPRRSHNPRPASPNCRRRRVRYHSALRRCTPASVRDWSQLCS